MPQDAIETLNDRDCKKVGKRDDDSNLKFSL